MKSIYFITYATHSERLFDTLLESAKRNAIKLNVIGLGEKWINWKHRAKQILMHLNTINDNMLICHIDGFDSIILGNATELYNKYIEHYSDKKIVFSSDNADNIFVKYFKLKKFSVCRDNFISAGLYMGYNHYVKDLLQKFIDSSETDDQRYFTSLCIDDNNIGIDNNILFYNYQYFGKELNYYNNRLIVNNMTPVIISAPGNTNIVKVVKHFGYVLNENYDMNTLGYYVKNSTGLCKFFKFEIIVFLILLICIIMVLS